MRKTTEYAEYAQRKPDSPIVKPLGAIFFFRVYSVFRGSVLCLSLLLGIFLTGPRCFAQAHAERPAPLDAAQAEREARELVAAMLSQRPAEDETNLGLLKIRGADDQEREIKVRFSTRTTATNWANVYTTVPSGGQPAVTLTVVHASGSNEYYLSMSSTNDRARRLTGAELMRPFADSDFWLADLGLQFLHWPKQKLLKKEVRRNKFCDVLESTNPQPTPGGYARIVCWITGEAPHGIVHADAYDAKGDVIKRFDPTEFKKIEGRWQLESMEIRNLKTDSRSVIEFNLK